MGACNPQRSEPSKFSLAPLTTSRGGLQGVDISNNNGPVSFTYLRKHGIAFVYVKGDEACSTDTQFASNVAKAAALRMPLGLYEFSRPGRIRSSSAAACMASLTRYAIVRHVLLLPDVFDVESFDEGVSGQGICNWLHVAEADLRADLHGVQEGVYGSVGTFPGCFPNGSRPWPADWLVSSPTALPGYSGAYFNWQYFGPRFASGTLDGMDRDKGSASILSLEYRAPETPSQKRARERRELAAHKQLRVQLLLQRQHLRSKLLKFGCDRRVKHHLKTGERCKGWKGAGGRVIAHIKHENKFVAQLERELR